MHENIYLEQNNETMGENSFMKKLLKKRLNQKGLTLIELLAVIVILAIVAAIAVPAIGNIISNSRIKAAKSDAVMVLNAAQLYETEKGKLTATAVDITDARFDDYMESRGNFATGTTVARTSSGLVIDGTWTEGSVTITFNDAPLSGINSSTTTDDVVGSTTVVDVP